jgi:hypothetical protein
MLEEVNTVSRFSSWHAWSIFWYSEDSSFDAMLDTIISQLSQYSSFQSVLLCLWLYQLAMYCYIPAVSRRRTYRRYSSLVGVELELWLRTGCDRLLASTVTGCTKCMELLWASNEVTRRARTQAVGNQPRQRFGGPQCWTSGDELCCTVLEMTVVNSEGFGKFGNNYRPEFSYSELCAARDGASAWLPVTKRTLTQAQFRLH